MKLASIKSFWRISLFKLCIFLIGCGKEDAPNPQNETIPKIGERTVLVYIAANNDLRNEAISSVRKLQKGAKSLNGNLLVFVKTNAQNSYLLKINYGTDETIVSDTLKIYGEENTSDAFFFGSVISDARKLYPAKTYGLVLWSHATAWVPPTDRISPMSFGWDDGKEMDILDLKTALPDDFEYIVFDACSMASMEVIYELKDKAKYILASPAEVLSTGFPYEKVTEHLFSDVSGLKSVSKLFVNHYKTLPGRSASATVSLIDTKELTSIALLTKTLIQAVSNNFTIDTQKVQRLDFDDAPVPGYDFLDFLEQHFYEGDIKDIKRAVDKAILFKGHTENFLGNPINAFSGLTVYIPTTTHQYKKYYKTLEWYSDSNWQTIFDFALL